MRFIRDVEKARYAGHLVLASSSERRKQLLVEAGYRYQYGASAPLLFRHSSNSG